MSCNWTFLPGEPCRPGGPLKRTVTDGSTNIYGKHVINYTAVISPKSLVDGKLLI